MVTEIVPSFNKIHRRERYTSDTYQWYDTDLRSKRLAYVNIFCTTFKI